MSKRSSKFSNPKNRASKEEWDAAKARHQYIKEHQKQTLEKLGLMTKKPESKESK